MDEYASIKKRIYAFDKINYYLYKASTTTSTPNTTPTTTL